jgi:serine/threonine-protein kinase
VAVAEAHALGIIHRDLKPSNLFCVRRSDGQLSIKVLDFGISKLTLATETDPSLGMTTTTTLMGSPLYMSPEQMRASKDVDATTDVWALGMTLFELLAGRTAFVASTVTELAIQVANEPAPSLCHLRAEVPAGLEGVVFRCLEKDRRHRYRNVGELARALLPFAPKRATASVERISGIIEAAGLADSERASPPLAAQAEGLSTEGTSPALTRTRRAAKRANIATLGGAALVGALCLVTGAVLTLRRTVAPTLQAESMGAASSTAAAFAPASSAGTVRLPAELQTASIETTLPPTVGAPSSASPEVPRAPTSHPLLIAPRSSAASSRGAVIPAPSASTAALPSVDAGRGFLTINSIPPSVCFLDGEALGATPRVGLPASPGTHTIRFFDVERALSKTITVRVEAGETTRAIVTLDSSPTSAGDAE